MVQFKAIADSTDSKVLVDLKSVFRSCFPGYEFFLNDIDENFVSPQRRGNLIIHQVVAYADGVPAGVLIIHTNIARSVTLIHFLGVVPSLRGSIPGERSIARRLVAEAERLLEADAKAHGINITHGLIADAIPVALDSWIRLGFTPVCIDFAEPEHGREWAKYGEPELHKLTLVALLSTAPTSSPDRIMRAGAEAYLIDHHRLPVDNPKVVELLGEAVHSRDENDKAP
jgi:hypothetical protein